MYGNLGKPKIKQNLKIFYETPDLAINNTAMHMKMKLSFQDSDLVSFEYKKRNDIARSQGITW